MTIHDDGADSEPFARPFLGANVSAGGAGTDSHHREEAEAVRPYFVTGGRVHDSLVGFDTIYALTAQGSASLAHLTFELRRIAELCRTPQSVAEISALLSLPLGVAMVLAHDLAQRSHLSATAIVPDPASDPALITRVINAVHRL